MLSPYVVATSVEKTRKGSTVAIAKLQPEPRAERYPRHAVFSERYTSWPKVMNSGKALKMTFEIGILVMIRASISRVLHAGGKVVIYG